MTRLKHMLIISGYAKNIFRSFTTNKVLRMAAVADGDLGALKMNGMERIPRPFVIGVAGGTASGKVTMIIHLFSHNVTRNYLSLVLKCDQFGHTMLHRWVHRLYQLFMMMEGFNDLD